MCTLKNFPNQIEHCIEWSRDLFEGSFVTAVQVRLVGAHLCACARACAFAVSMLLWLFLSRLLCRQSGLASACTILGCGFPRADAYPGRG
jgi:hypothetical protein